MKGDVYKNKTEKQTNKQKERKTKTKKIKQKQKQKQNKTKQKHKVLPNRIAKLINGTSTQALYDLDWKKLDDKLQVNEAVTVYKVMNNQALNYLWEMFVRKETRYNTRIKNDIVMVKSETEYMFE